MTPQRSIALTLIDVPPETANVNVSSTLFPSEDREDINHLHLVALPNKLVLVRAHVKSSLPESFDIFELKMGDDEDGTRSCKMINGIGSDHDLFLDGHHAIFDAGAGGTGNRIY